MSPPLSGCWVFDLDGTLTVAQHDFAAIKQALGLPADRPLLDGALASDDRERVLAAIHDWEGSLAEQAVARPGAAALLEALGQRGIPAGVLTRNSRETALRTLRAAGLAGAIPADLVVGRDCAPPKPAPDGVHLVARRARRPATVMVGDFRFDLEAGRAAGAFAVWLDADRTGEHAHLADLVVHELSELMPAATT